MKKEFSTPAQVYFAVAMTVTGADGRLSDIEFEELFPIMEEVSVFQGIDSMGELAEDVAIILEKDFSGGHVALSEDEIKEIVRQGNTLLSQEQKQELFSMAMRLAYSDGLHPYEKKVMDDMWRELEIDIKFIRKVYKQYGQIF